MCTPCPRESRRALRQKPMDETNSGENMDHEGARGTAANTKRTGRGRPLPPPLHDEPVLSYRPRSPVGAPSRCRPPRTVSRSPLRPRWHTRGSGSTVETASRFTFDRKTAATARPCGNSPVCGRPPPSAPCRSGRPHWWDRGGRTLGRRTTPPRLAERMLPDAAPPWRGRSCDSGGSPNPLSLT